MWWRGAARLLFLQRKVQCVSLSPCQLCHQPSFPLPRITIICDRPTLTLWLQSILCCCVALLSQKAQYHFMVVEGRHILIVQWSPLRWLLGYYNELSTRRLMNECPNVYANKTQYGFNITIMIPTKLPYLKRLRDPNTKMNVCMQFLDWF